MNLTTKSNQKVQLTGFRGVAAVMVLVSHAANDEFIPKYLGVGYGQIGVILFFILSGYLMSMLYLDKEFNLINVKKYLIARIARIIPLFYLAICIFIICSHFYPEIFTYPITNKSLIISSFSCFAATNILWTIPIEMRYYLFFIFFWLIGSKINSLPLKVLILFSPFLYFILFSIYTNSLSRLFSGYSLFFALGTLAFYIEKLIWFEKLKQMKPWTVILVCLLTFLNFPILRWKLGFYWGPWFDIITMILCFSTFILVLVNHKSLSIFNNSKLVFLGEISFGLYLLHFPILFFSKILLGANILTFFVFLSFSIIIAEISRRYWELPISNLIKKATS